jgi:hypothetical protein
MQVERTSFSFNAERRATMQEGPGARPAVARTRAKAVTAADRPQAALTRRERKVKDMLLRELKRVNSWQGLSYLEKQNIEKRLDPSFLDKEIEKLKKQMRWAKRATPFILLYGVFYAFITIDGPPSAETMWQYLLVGLLLAGYLVAPFVQRNSLRRKLFIYEALRELSDADEIDVILDRASREADQLIEQIVQRELEIERRFPTRLTA